MNNTNILKTHIIGAHRCRRKRRNCRATDGTSSRTVLSPVTVKNRKNPLAGASSAVDVDCEAPAARDAVEGMGGLHAHNRAATNGKN